MKPVLLSLTAPVNPNQPIPAPVTPALSTPHYIQRRRQKERSGKPTERVAYPAFRRHVESDGSVFDQEAKLPNGQSRVVYPHGDHFHLSLMMCFRL